MKKRSKLTKLLSVFSSDGTEVDFSEFDRQVDTLKSSLKEKIQVKTLDDVNNQLDLFKRKINLQGIIDSVDKIRTSMDDKIETVVSEIENKASELEELISKNDQVSKERVSNLKPELDDLKTQLSTLEETRKVDLKRLQDSIPSLEDLENRVDETILELATRIDALEDVEMPEIKDWQETIDDLRREILSKLSGLGGGSMNRQITVGNTDPLTKYTDINLKAGSNVTITTANNETTKRVDITISSSGGGGSVIGTTRTITTLTVTSVIGTTAGTDQVYLANGGLQITLPTAVGDTNLYTIKNIGTSSILVNTTGGQTIDNDTTIIMPVRYTSVDLISDSANWNIT